MGQLDIDGLLANPDHDPLVNKAWEGLGRHGGSVRNVRKAIAASWLRCVDSRVDPQLKQAPTPLNSGELEKLRAANKEILEASVQIIEIARKLLAGSGAAMMLTDRNGVILKIDGDVRALGVLEALNMLPGASWNECYCGTNAIGTTLLLGLPVQIHGPEHFCESIKRFTCSAATIADPVTGDVLGVVNVSGFASTYSPQTLTLVVNAAQRIKEAIQTRLLAIRYKVLEHLDAKLSTSDRASVVLLDCHDTPIRVGAKVAAALASFGISEDQLLPPTFSGIADFCRFPSDTTKSTLPPWLNVDWIDPIYEGDQHLGCIVRVPPTGTHSSVLWEADSVVTQAFANAKGRSPAFVRAVNRAGKVAKSKVPVLLLGETGAGKEVFANGIHNAATGGKAPYIVLNCGALSRDLLASELFGYVDGAFTGARRGGMIGKIEAADGGTLFLDEIGEMPLELQPTLLRVLEKREVVRLGETQPRTVSFRLVCATNRDLKKEVAEGRFRSDLYYRISVVSIKIPSLRERPGDPSVLAEYYLKSLCSLHDVAECQFSDEALQRLNSYEWPGNIRELRNVVESLVLSARDTIISREDVDAELSGTSPDIGSIEADHITGDLARGEFEQIMRALQRTSGNATQAARELGIAKSTLYLKVKKLGLSAFLDSQRSTIK